MALGRSQIVKLSAEMFDVAEAKSIVLDDCWNTFQYVVNNLEEWADETTIGNELKRDLKELVDKVKTLNDYLDRIYKETQDFWHTQEKINRG